MDMESNSTTEGHGPKSPYNLRSSTQRSSQITKEKLLVLGSIRKTELQEQKAWKQLYKALPESIHPEQFKYRNEASQLELLEIVLDYIDSLAMILENNPKRMEHNVCPLPDGEPSLHQRTLTQSEEPLRHQPGKESIYVSQEPLRHQPGKKSQHDSEKTETFYSDQTQLSVQTAPSIQPYPMEEISPRIETDYPRTETDSLPGICTFLSSHSTVSAIPQCNLTTMSAIPQCSFTPLPTTGQCTQTMPAIPQCHLTKEHVIPQFNRSRLNAESDRILPRSRLNGTSENFSMYTNLVDTTLNAPNVSMDTTPNAPDEVFLMETECHDDYQSWESLTPTLTAITRKMFNTARPLKVPSSTVTTSLSQDNVCSQEVCLDSSLLIWPEGLPKGLHPMDIDYSAITDLDMDVFQVRLYVRYMIICKLQDM
ncbi:unnamed protein product [Owenia fusiformis]|uniref:Uncharacterized protein n=1 Tax=Owenia fusiformis TaxID=6347 RepID=A0A8S4PZC0_OWEFU|nr:unnamed protein product [Owenia fusiformis]